MNTMKCNSKVSIALAAMMVATGASAVEDAEQDAPLKILLVAGGCCHDYATQSRLLKVGIEERIHAVVTVVFNPSTSTDTRFEIYESDKWAEGYDVVLHDECSAAVTDKSYVERILAAHRNGVPAVNVHCAMHSYRWGSFREPVELGADNAGWYEMIGVQSTGHGPQSPIDVRYTDATHPVTKGFKHWTTVNEELYNNVQVFGGTRALASGTQQQHPRKRELKKNPAARPREANAIVVWTNEYGPNRTKIFSTTLGHNNETVGDPRYLDLVVRGLLWCTDNLSDDGTPTAVYAK
jgi:type 1 glutamine amidotransferase